MSICLEVIVVSGASPIAQPSQAVKLISSMIHKTMVRWPRRCTEMLSVQEVWETPILLQLLVFAATLAQNIHLPLFSAGAMLLWNSEWPVYFPAPAETASCCVQNMVRLGLGGLMEYKHQVFVKYCEYSAPDM